jgi:hypothetical protein
MSYRPLKWSIISFLMHLAPAAEHMEQSRLTRKQQQARDALLEKPPRKMNNTKP